MSKKLPNGLVIADDVVASDEQIETASRAMAATRRAGLTTIVRAADALVGDMLGEIDGEAAPQSAPRHVRQTAGRTTTSTVGQMPTPA